MTLLFDRISWCFARLITNAAAGVPHLTAGLKQVAVPQNRHVKANADINSPQSRHGQRRARSLSLDTVPASVRAGPGDGSVKSGPRLPQARSAWPVLVPTAPAVPASWILLARYRPGSAFLDELRRAGRTSRVRPRTGWLGMNVPHRHCVRCLTVYDSSNRAISF